MTLADKAAEYADDTPDTPDITVGHAVPLADHDDGSADWKLARKKGLGGSDAAKVLGLQPYDETRVDLWRIKTGREESKVGNAAVRYGSTIEPYIRQWLTNRATDTPAFWADWSTLVDYPVQMHHPDHEWARANIDGLLTDDIYGDGEGEATDGVEIKASTYRHGRGRPDWVEPGVQAYHYPQIQHYLWVTGLERWRYVYLCVPFDREMAMRIADTHARDVDEYWLWMVDQATITTRIVERDDDYIRRLADAEQSFWANHIEADKCPDEWLPDGEVQVEHDELADLLEEYGRATAKIKASIDPEASENEKEAAKQEIKKLAQSVSADHGDAKKIHIAGTDDYVLWHGSGYWVAKPAERTPIAGGGDGDESGAGDIDLGF